MDIKKEWKLLGHSAGRTNKGFQLLCTYIVVSHLTQKLFGSPGFDGLPDQPVIFVICLVIGLILGTLLDYWITNYTN